MKIGQKKQKFNLCLLIMIFLVLQGCLKPNIPMPKTPPSIIKAYEHIIIYGGSTGFKNSGVFLKKGDFFSVIATGGINMCPRSNSCTYNYNNLATPDQFLNGRIGDDYLITAGYLGLGGVRKSYWSGYLHLGYTANYPEDDSGAFNIDILVWSEENYSAIADFYRLMQQRNPEEKQLRLAASQVEAQGKLAQASKEVEVTRKEIETLSKEISKPTEGKKILTGVTQQIEITSNPAENQDSKIAHLEMKLKQLEQLLTKMDELKKGLEKEKIKSTELSRNLEKKEKREQQLLNRLKTGAAVPPVIVIANPENNSKVETNTIKLNGVVEDTLGVSSFEIFINNRPLLLENTRGISINFREPNLRYDFRERIPLQVGDNTLRIVAENEAGLSVEKLLKIHYSERRNNIWAVIVGIDRYPKVRHLKYAVNDARAMYNHLIKFSQIPSENVSLLLDQDATLTRLRSALGTHLKNKAGPEDMVIIFFAGHGATEKDMMSPDGDGLEKYLLPYDADPKDLYATALPMGEISRIFNRIRSDRLLFVADSCYSGASGGRTIGIDGIRANLSDAFLDRVTGGKGRVVISASGANEVSSESDRLKQGIFTYYLLEGLKGAADTDKDNVVTVDEAFQFVSDHVPNATNQEQHPIRKGTVTGNFVLSVLN